MPVEILRGAFNFDCAARVEVCRGRIAAGSSYCSCHDGEKKMNMFHLYVV